MGDIVYRFPRLSILLKYVEIDISTIVDLDNIAN